MLDTIAGLPIHPLVVHATVVAVPTAAFTVLLAALWPRFRRWAGWLPLALSAASIALVPLSTSSGESLEERVGDSALVERHAELGEGLLVWVVVLLLAAVALQVRDRLAARRPSNPAGTSAAAGEGGPGRRRAGGLLATVVTLLLVTAGVGGTVVQTVLIGHSGAQASWDDVPAPSGEGGDEDDD
ncbi:MULTISPECIES: DUF2231 domain-containing protein [unclassified Ornithinimicrobium]|uniref:DUF2231 domain-containing protein n=1 Tax=unclassified Ornithinimicrobium TaxID=2615080 RepID=UPI0038531CC6